jgi:hypothetical protein
MIFSTRTRELALLALVTGCAPGRETPPPDAAAAAPHVVDIATANHTFQAPDTIDAGWTTFRFANNGDDIHYAHIVRLDSAHTLTDLVEAYAEAIRTSGPRPKWVMRFGGPGGMSPGGTAVVTQHLEPGSYVWICPVEDDAGNPHFGKGEFKPFVIRESGVQANAAGPVASATIQLLDFGFALETPLTPGHHTIRIVNTGVEPHDMNLIKLAPGGTLEAVRDWLNPEKARRPDQATEQPPPIEGLAGGIAAIGSGLEGFFDADLTPGDYVLACMATAPDGRSHIEHGMIQHIRIQ